MPRPRTSIVIASAAGGAFLSSCLQSLRDQAAARGAEIIVVDRVGEAHRQQIARDCPSARVIAAPSTPRPTVPQMRRVGVDAASGSLVAVIEEHCVAPPGWLDTIETAFGATDVAIGGPILDDHYTRLRDWVVYFSEYHNYIPPWLDGPRQALNGANIVYDRAALLRHRDVLDQGYWEVVLHPLLARDGTFRAVNGMGVVHRGPFDFGYYLRQRYLLSRAWGGAEKDRVSGGRRLAHILLAPIFPVVMLARIGAAVRGQERLARQYLAVLPMLGLAMCALTLGETLGYLVGPGRALEEVE